MDLGCVNGGLWTVEVVVGCAWQWRWLGFWVCLLFFRIFNDRFVVFFFGSEVYYFIVVDIFFYFDIYIILLC